MQITECISYVMPVVHTTLHILHTPHRREHPNPPPQSARLSTTRRMPCFGFTCRESGARTMRSTLDSSSSPCLACLHKDGPGQQPLFRSFSRVPYTRSALRTSKVKPSRLVSPLGIRVAAQAPARGICSIPCSCRHGPNTHSHSLGCRPL